MEALEHDLHVVELGMKKSGRNVLPTFSKSGIN